MHNLKYEENHRFFSDLFDELFPIFRSITGPGIRASYDIFQRYMPLETESAKTGEYVFDWQVPQEWECRHALLISPDGEVICDSKRNNLEVVNYSVPMDIEIELDELQPHLYSLPNQPHAIPYVTSYYRKHWGFCLTDYKRKSLKPGKYKVIINSKLYDGSIEFRHTKLKGCSDKEIFLSSYLCHPSMANNELSGPLVLLGLYKRISNWKIRNYSYRFILNPETIGSLTVLNKFSDVFKEKLIAGLVLTCMGGASDMLTFKLSRNRNGMLDKIIEHFKDNLGLHRTVLFSPIAGSDERQYNSPGFQLPVCTVSRSLFEGYSEYHTSLDDKEFMGIDKILDSIDYLEKILIAMDQNVIFNNESPFGEPNLGKRDLYPTVNFIGEYDKINFRTRFDMMLTLLNYADGTSFLVDIAERSGYSMSDLTEIAILLQDKGLISIKDFDTRKN